MTEGQSAWVVISKDPDTLSWGSHSGYDDQINEYYSYDSQVGNYKNVQVGDLVFVKGEDHLLGFGEIESITSEKAIKEMRRCPKCGESPESRMIKVPKWRCRSKECNYEFDDNELTKEDKEVIKFRASYKNTWRDANFPITRHEVFAFQATRDNQSAIRKLDSMKLSELIRKIMGSNDLPVENIAEIPNLIIGGHVIQLTKRRVGQQEFRLALLEKHGENCLISGAQPACVLEAAHIKKFAKYESHELNSGLLLRRDFHTLFDRHLIRINPNTWQTEVSPRIRHYESYKTLHLSEIRGDRERRPASEALLAHYELAASFF
jgi:hypothetical protein